MRDLERMSKGDYPSLEGTSDEMETVVSWCVGLTNKGTSPG